MILQIEIKRNQLWLIALSLISAVSFGGLLGDAIHRGFAITHLVGLFLSCLNIILLWFSYQTLNFSKKTVENDDPHHARALEHRIQSLQGQVELLTALREMSRIVSDDLDFQKMISEVFIIIDGLLNTECMTLFIPNENGQLIARAQKIKQKINFEDDVQEIDWTNIYEAAENRCTLRILEDNRLSLATPLVADNEFIGVLSLEFYLYGDLEHRQEQTERYESILMDTVKHVALVIKTDNLYTQGIIDELTGLYSKRHFLNEINKAFQITARSDVPLSLVMIDIDHFKKINDTYGHLTGDEVLREVPKMIKKLLRQNDRAYRFGGEEIILLLSGSNQDTAHQIAERIRQIVAKRIFYSEKGEPFSITISLGISTYTREMNEAMNLVSEADKALYYCKQHGRNQTRIQPDFQPLLNA